MENNQTNSKKSNRGGARAGAGRPRKSNEPLSPADRIKLLEAKLVNPETGAKAAASVARQISILNGEIKTYPKKKAEPAPLALTPLPAVVTEPTPEELAASAQRNEEQRKWWAQTDAERAAYWRAQRAAIYPDEERVNLLAPEKRLKYYDRNLTPDDRRAFLAKELSAGTKPKTAAELDPLWAEHTRQQFGLA